MPDWKSLVRSRPGARHRRDRRAGAARRAALLGPHRLGRRRGRGGAAGARAARRSRARRGRERARRWRRQTPAPSRSIIGSAPARADRVSTAACAEALSMNASDYSLLTGIPTRQEVSCHVDALVLGRGTASYRLVYRRKAASAGTRRGESASIEGASARNQTAIRVSEDHASK